MTVTMVMDEALHNHLFDIAQFPMESAGVLLARKVELPTGDVRLVVHAFHEVPEEHYSVRTSDALEIASDGYVHALAEAARTNSIAVWTHTHPGASSRTRPSRHDVAVNADLTDLFKFRTGSGYYGWLILGHRDGELAFTGALDGLGGGPIERMSALGERFHFRRADDSVNAQLPSMLDRNIRAFGKDIQTTISELVVAVVGVGGTGSSVTEQLVRLGVRNFILIDPDNLSDSNVTRVYGSGYADVGRPKVDVLQDHLERIAADARVKAIQGSIVNEGVARALLSADIVFGCTDDNAGRLRLSRLPYFQLIPVIDCGVLLEAQSDGTLAGVFARVTVIHPGTACLVCRSRIDLAMAEAEGRPASEQKALVKEGYAPALPGVEPAVVAFTTLVAAAAVSELLERLVGYGERPTPSELILRIHDREMRANSEAPHDGHYCDPRVVRARVQDDDMLLGMNWPS